MWSPKQQLIKHAKKLAEAKHPGGYNKSQLIKASEEVFGGFGAAILYENKAVQTKEDIQNQRNSMALIDGHYPLSLSDCEVCGLSGACGPECPARDSEYCTPSEDWPPIERDRQKEQ